MIEAAQVVIVISMLSIATLSDVRSRSVNDAVWILFAVSGLALNLFAGHARLLEIITVTGICAGVAFLVWRTRAIGTADFFAMLALSAAAPSFASVAFFPVIIMVEVVIVASVYVIVANLRYNIRDIMNGDLFCDVDESSMRKVIGAFIVHRKRGHEKFTFPGVTRAGGKSRFVFFHDSDSQGFDEGADYVSLAVPLMPFFLISTVITIIFIMSRTYSMQF